MSLSQNEKNIINKWNREIQNELNVKTRLKMMLKKIYKKTNRFNKIEKISYKNRLHTEQENTTKHINTNCEGEEGGRKIEEN